VVLPQLDSSGRIKVVTEGQGTKFFDQGAVAGSLSLTEVAADTTIATATDYGEVVAHGCCTRISLFQLSWIDDYGVTDVETVIDSFLVGPGQYSFRWQNDAFKFTSGSTGTQAIVLKAKNLFKASDLKGSIGCEAA
jgi:hypothetical protein